MNEGEEDTGLSRAQCKIGVSVAAVSKSLNSPLG